MQRDDDLARLHVIRQLHDQAPVIRNRNFQTVTSHERPPGEVIAWKGQYSQPHRGLREWAANEHILCTLTSIAWQPACAVVASTDKLSGLADKIFEDSRDRAAALVHEARKAGQAAQAQTQSKSPLSDGIRDIKEITALMNMMKALAEDKDPLGKV